MQKQPTNQISIKGLRVWRLYGIMLASLIALIAGVLAVLTYVFTWPWWIYIMVGVVATVSAYLLIFLFPKIRWLRWRYEVREAEIELQHGLFIVKRTLVPMVRVQHVNTVQGPILRKYHLSSITISTAATNHVIPLLEIEEADELRQRISALARVAEEDV